MDRTMVEENGDAKNSSYVKQETVSYAYDPSFMNYSTTTTTPTTLNQPLPGQPPLPPMPPPQGAVPPPPTVYGSVQAQVTPIHAWQHPATWQWLTPQAAALPTQAVAAAAYQREVPMRNNYVKRERFNSHNRNYPHQQRGNFYRKNRRQQRYDAAHSSQFGTASNAGIDWQRNNDIIQGMVGTNSGGPDVKEEIVIKKNNKRKPMSQSYPSRPWNKEDADKALMVENDYNKAVKAQSLIIKFPDPDLNKEIVRDFHTGIKSIHFQSPSGPRYCFIQMAENINIDDAIKDLEKVRFGNGYLKVERKSLRDEDTPTSEEIDPYTLYIGNLPETVNVNEVKSRFQTAVRVDVGYAQKMRNTRYAFIRYNTVEESIEAYKKAHDLMWDTRSIIVRFRRQRGNTCLPGEPKSNPKKKDVAKASSATCKSTNESSKSAVPSAENDSQQSKRIENNTSSENHNSISTSEPSTSGLNASLNGNELTKPVPENFATNGESMETDMALQEDDMSLIADIKEEPVDYDEMIEISMGEDDDDDDYEGDIYNHEVEEDDDDSDFDDDMSNLKPTGSGNSGEVPLKQDIPADNLDKLFSDINHSINGDIES